MENIQRKLLRIVGMSDSRALVFIQRYSAFGWMQSCIDRLSFKDLMIKEFPDYWEEYVNSGAVDYVEYFYNYGEASEKSKVYDAFGFAAIMGADTSRETYIFR